MVSSLESIRIERLIGLCKLWGNIKVFHPYLAYRQDIDWDAALVAAIPRVNAAKDACEYATAVHDMLSVLGDPVTRVVPDEPASSSPPPHEIQPSYRFTPDHILVVRINYYQDLVNLHGAAQRLQATKMEIPKASGVLFDLRAAAPLSQEEEGSLLFVFHLSDIATMLSSTLLITAGERTRMHLGLAPQIRGMGFPYKAAFQVMDGLVIMPAPEARELPVVFLINGWSELPPEALALQIAGKAAIIVEGDPSDVSLGVKTHQIPLSDGVLAEIRLGEIVSQDGCGGFLPDKVIPPSPLPGKEDQGLATALDLLKDFKPVKTKRIPLPAHAAPMPENSYPEMAFPPLEYRLLAVFRIWTMIHYFFPYKDLIEENWDDGLREYIHRMEQADSALSYHLAVAEMVTHLHDSHGGVYSPVLRQEFAHQFGPAVPPVGLQIIENVPVITAIFDEEVARDAGVCIGDILLQIDGDSALERIAKCAKYRAASTPQSLMHRAALASLSGSEDSFAVLTLCDRNQQVKEVRLPRKAAYGSWGTLGISQRAGEAFRLLTEEIGYTDLDRLEAADVDAMLEKFKYTKGIIFDMRGFPQMTAWAVAPRLAEESGVTAARFRRPLVMAPDGSGNDMERHSANYTIMQSIPPTDKWRYKGKTVMLIDERAISRSEHTGLFFEAANGTKFIGSPTSGANGDITNMNVPGGIIILFTGQGVRHADGRQLQRIGLVPDVEVRPTIKGIQNGKDEILDAAIQFLQCEIGETQQKD